MPFIKNARTFRNREIRTVLLCVHIAGKILHNILKILALCLGFQRFELCQKGPFKSISFLPIFAILICRKINELSASENLLSKCDLNGPFCYTMTQVKVRLTADVSTQILLKYMVRRSRNKFGMTERGIWQFGKLQ